MRRILLPCLVAVLAAASITPSLARKAAHHHHRYDQSNYGQSYDNDVPHYGPYLHSQQCAPRYDSAGVAIGCL
jgi:hypothetical protein